MGAAHPGTFPIHARDARANVLRSRTRILRSIYPQKPSDDHATEHVVAFDIKTVVNDEPEDGSFPPWPRHRPVAASFLSADWHPDRRYCFRLDTPIPQPGEDAKFCAQVDRLMPKGVVGITYNGLDGPPVSHPGLG